MCQDMHSSCGLHVERMTTNDRLCAWGTEVEPVFSLCKTENGTLNHLYFSCASDL